LSLINPTPESEVIGRRLKLARTEARYTLEQVAEIMKRARNSVWRWENGDIKIGVEDLMHLGRLYNVTTSWLVGEEDLENEILAEGELALRTASKELSPSAMRSLVETIKFLRDQQIQEKIMTDESEGSSDD
jgi:transcriptional regulator with XRE-family HTH domain